MNLLTEKLAVHGGPAVRSKTLPYGHQTIGTPDVEAVVEALRSAWLTTGPAVDQFERDFASTIGAEHAIAVSSGTAALHTACHALRIGKGDEVIVPATTFIASSNSVIYVGGVPVFADVEADTLTISASDVEAKITDRTKAIVAVDFAGLPCNYEALRAIADARGIPILSDSCHSLGATVGGAPAATLADISVFSFHPVKHITTGEGGMICTNQSEWATRARRFRNHGIATDHRQRSMTRTFHYEMVELGYNYRITDLQCALGSSQLRQLPTFLEKRRRIAAYYDEQIQKRTDVQPLARRRGAANAYHLYVVKFQLERLRADRSALFAALNAEGIGVNVHYQPVYQHPYYRQQFGDQSGCCPEAERAYERILSLPIFPEMSMGDAEDVIAALRKVLDYYGGV
jgi:perosamine synthetase